MSEFALQKEHHNLAAVFQELRYSLPDTMPPISFAKAVASPFAPDQLPPMGTLHNLTPDNRNYLTAVQLELGERIKQGDPDALGLGHAAGRCLGALIDNHLFRPRPPVQLEIDSITADGHTIDFSYTTGKVVELGMGINGLATHIDSLKSNPKHTMGGIVHTNAEAVLLEGMAAYHGVRNQVAIDVGISDSVENMIARRHHESIDVVISSRAHQAGEQLLQSMRMAPGLLRRGGVIITRGPSSWNEQGIESGYKQVGHILGSDERLRVNHDFGFSQTTPGFGSEVSHLTIAQRV